MNDSVVWGDALRFANIVMGALLITSIALVVLQYARSYRAHVEMRKRGLAARWTTLLPVHVVTIGLSYLALVVTTLIIIIGRVHAPLTWRAPVVFASYVLGVLAMRAMLMFSRRRHRLDDSDTPSSEL